MRLRTFLLQVLVESEVLLVLAPRLSAGLKLSGWTVPDLGDPAGLGESAEEARQQQ